jgi:hypothetical protein
MGLKQKCIEETDVKIELTAKAVMFILEFEEELHEVIAESLTHVKYPGIDVYDSCAIVIDDAIKLRAKIYGDINERVVVYNIEDIDDINEYLDYINEKKVVKWNTDMMI